MQMLKKMQLNHQILRHRSSPMWLRLCFVILFLGFLETGRGQFLDPASTNDPAELSLEQLINIKVTSVSKKETFLENSPAAVAVVTQEDIRRSGARSIAEALRMVPGLDVARVDANKWAVSSRGFNGLYANKLLVLMDGRTLYSPLFAGVHWGMQDTMLEDINRIEVIRGPGASLWGANAVNGVINIITKSAKETQGTLVTGGSGSEEPGFGGIRYGGKLGDNAHYRVYSKYGNHDDSIGIDGRDGADEWDMFRAGFRLDWEANDKNSLTFQGDYFTGSAGGNFTVNQFDLSQSIVEKLDVTGGNILGRWKHTISDTSDLEVQAYYDRVDRRSPFSFEVIDTFDIDSQHRFALGERNEIVWGVGYRCISDHNLSTDPIAFDPDSAAHQIFNTFVQDEIKVVPDRLHFILGTKLEHNDYTGLEVQPNARLLLMPDEKQTVWASVARAVRTPTRFENDLRFPIGSIPGSGGMPPTELSLLGNSEFESEKLIAYELGYRIQPTPDLSFDLAGFYNVYDDLRTTETGAAAFEPTPQPHVEVPMRFGNKLRGETYGTELAANWKATEIWKLGCGYSWLHMRLRPDASSNSSTARDAEGDSPQHQFNVHSYLDLPHNLELDTAIYYVDSLANQNVSSYARLDIRLGWHATKNLDFSLGLQNLLDNRHREFGTSTGAQSTLVDRSIYGKVTWRF